MDLVFLVVMYRTCTYIREYVDVVNSPLLIPFTICLRVTCEQLENICEQLEIICEKLESICEQLEYICEQFEGGGGLRQLSSCEYVIYE